MGKNVKQTLREIKEKIEILSEIALPQSKKKSLQVSMAIDTLQTLVLAEYRLKDKLISIEEKKELCDVLSLLFMQVRKLEKINQNIYKEK